MTSLTSARIDHVVAVVEDFDAARHAWIEAGCPVLYDGTTSTHRACCVSIGSINLELLSSEAFDGWPALRTWCAKTGRRFGIQAMALDPGDLDSAIAVLRGRGVAVSEPREGQLRAANHADVTTRWRLGYVDGLAGLLPGVASFLCEFVAPHTHLGRAFPESPLQLVELAVGCPDPDATVQLWQSVIGSSGHRDGNGFLVGIGDTSLRVTRGRGMTVLIGGTHAQSTRDRLAAAVPDVRIEVRSGA